MIFEVTEGWRSAFPQAHAGVLVIKDVVNPARHEDLQRRKERLVEMLRALTASSTAARCRPTPGCKPTKSTISASRKTYHVQLQLESIAFKGKTIPNVAALVEAMFMAEIENRLADRRA